jgi:hypothetical protein
MPSRKAPVTISVDAKIRLLFPVGSWHLLDSPGAGQKLGTLYRGQGIIELLGYYDSAFAAADSVYTQSTGWNCWDQRKRIDAPSTLLLWSKKPVK